MKKGLTSIFIAVAYSAGTIINAGAFGGTYPKSTGYVPFNEPPLLSEKYAYTSSEKKNLFKALGKSFILLDTDGEGNFLIMTEEHYGQHAFETSTDNHLLLEKAVQDGSGYSFERKNSMNTADWIFNPNNPDSIAYWLNNDFYNNGNGRSYVLPEGIKEHIIEKDWEIEGFKTYYGSGTRLYDRYFDNLGVSGYTSSNSLAENIFCEPYTVRCKIALMSITEYMQYQNLIGISFGYGAWGGMMLRSQDAFLTTGDENLHTELKCYFGPMQATRQTKGEDSTKLLKINIADAPNSSYYFVRPVFWLSKDFFKSVKCDIESIGIYPLEYIRENSYSELSSIYTDAELEKLGMYYAEGEFAKVKPTADDVGFFGDAAVGKKISGRYKYNKNSELEHDGLAEFGSKYQWYISNSVSGEKIPVANADGLEFILTDEMAGKYLWFSVTPQNAFTNRGETVFSDKAVKIRDANNISVTFRNESGEEITSIGSNSSVSVNIDYNIDNSGGATVYWLKFDSDRRLLSMQTENLFGSSQSSSVIKVSPGDSVKVMVLDRSKGSAPYCVYEIN